MPLLMLCLFAGHANAQRHPSVLTLKMPLGQGGTPICVTIAPLMYGKDFAFSFTLDDGLISDYLVALPFFRGGRVAPGYTDEWGSDQGGDGRDYPGLFYTDGCGTQEAFRAAVALNALHIIADTARARGFLSWAMADSLRRAGWDVLSHGYRHLTGGGIDAWSEVQENNRAVEAHLHVRMRDFVIPGGHDDILSDGPYTRAAFRARMETVQCEHFGNWVVDLNTVQYAQGLKLGRDFLHTPVSTGSAEGASPVFARIAAGLNAGERFWINAFTHGVGNQNLWKISLAFPEFRDFFRQLATQYGADGRDNMWMAPTQEVFEYLMTSRLARCTARRAGKNLLITIDLRKVPRTFIYHELTLRVEGTASGKIEPHHCRVVSSGTGRSPLLVNLHW